MRYSIITPTLVRSTLRRLCISIDAQTNGDWEHLVGIDTWISKDKQKILDSLGADPRRRVFQFTDKHDNDFGNHCRRAMFDKARGEYILYIDDDDFYADVNVFKTLETVTETWSIHPVLALGKICHAVPPRIHHTGSAMFMYRRDTGIKFPDNADYSADGQVVEELREKYQYQNLSSVRPLVIYEKANHGTEDVRPITRFNV